MIPSVTVMAWRRPGLLEGLLSAIPSSGVSSVVIGVDGPSGNFTRDRIKTLEVARTYERISAFPVIVIDRPRNIGAAANVVQTVTSALALSPRTIVLEDDCRPSPAFFAFAVCQLAAYAPRADVWAVCGSQYAPQHLIHGSHVLSRHFLGWGWAVDREKWRRILAALRQRPRAPSGSGRLSPSELFWYHGARRAHEGLVDAWDIPLMYAMRRAGGYCVLPRRNLVANVGFGVGASHTHSPSEGMLLPAEDQLDDGEVAPQADSLAVDEWLEARHFGISRRHLLSTRLTRLRDSLAGPEKHWASLAERIL